MMRKIKVLIVDDRDIIRDGLKLILSTSPDIIIEDDASDGKEAMDLIKKNNYDVVLMDINMPNMNGIDATSQIIKLNKTTKVLANSFLVDAEYINKMLCVGASGFVKKGESRDSYIEAIKTVFNGGIYLTDEIGYETYDKVLAYMKFPVEY